MTTTGVQPLTPYLHENIARIIDQFGESSDIVIRELGIGLSGELPAAIVFTDGLADPAAIHELLDSLILFSGDLRNSDGSVLSDIPGALERYPFKLIHDRKCHYLFVADNEKDPRAISLRSCGILCLYLRQADGCAVQAAVPVHFAV
ncbi:spore germination protein [Paenibacillus aceris]|uniref:Spore germination protein n=1 Tax=Paenibacillus aceris TaxID=869555 RepID=A0ABS4I4V5_9BACL|nr:spore germination protein [Paenibacillus aceris]MBP1965952.1 hypothetical protein [Paenibacillus aceris]NHW35051.1 spore germination protein [Paenibacillus aceris]